ncbi:cell division cycle protein 123 homolog [Halichondria panicea]|uniref:cell division cycle protein 123 homolog n=1 Tax=Halichondria panicea TaxID=6063 RepID=UPI00312BAF16
MASLAREEQDAMSMQPTQQEVVNCALPSWYKEFSSITFKSVFIPLSGEFVSFLLSDGCVLPEGCFLPAMDVCGGDSSSDEADDWNEGDSNQQTKQAPAFLDIVQSITEGIKALGGEVLPKLNWSAPRDAVWVVPSNSLRCTCAAEVILLLKSSNFITHDLTRVFEYCLPSATKLPFQYQLCLRKSENIRPSAEFRCFVLSHTLIGICQRNHTACYKNLLEMRDTLRAEIISFFDEIKGKFPNDNYVFDICRIQENSYWLVDFNPYCSMTDPLLFSWEELTSGAVTAMAAQEQLPVLRLVDGVSIQPSDLQTHRLPQDIIDLTSGEDIHKFADIFLKGSLLGQDSDSNSD